MQLQWEERRPHSLRRGRKSLSHKLVRLLELVQLSSPEWMRAWMMLELELA